MKRRGWLRQAGAWVAGGCALTACRETPSEKGANDFDKMFLHHVLFYMAHPDSAEEREALEAALRRLASIDLIRWSHVGVHGGTDREVIAKDYQYSILFVFDSKEDQDQYQIHPDHLAFVEACSHLWTKVLVIDNAPLL